MYLSNFRMFFVLLLIFGLSIALMMLTKFRPESYQINEDELYMGGRDGGRMTMPNLLSRSYSRAYQGASALMQALNNMSSTNNRRRDRLSYQQLMNFWMRRIPEQAWNSLPSTRYVLYIQFDDLSE